VACFNSGMRFGTARRSVHFLAIVLLAFLVGFAPLTAQEAVRSPSAAAEAKQDFGHLLDRVADTINEHFWDKQRLSEVEWTKLVAAARKDIVEAPDIETAAHRINALLGNLRMSHTGFLTPDDVDYYVLLSVFGSAGMPAQEFNDRFWGANVTYPGIGHFAVRLDGRDFVDLLLEGSPADRVGLKVGDEIVAVDGAAHHQIRSFRGKVGHTVQVTVRRARDGPVEIIPVKVVSIAPLHAFREATNASARTIELNGRRIGYVHVWDSVGEESANALQGALSKLGVNSSVERPRRGRRDEDAPQPLDGLIIDMRGKIGGTATTAARYLNIIDPRGPLMESRNHTPRSTAVRGRTAVLIDQHTRSTAELFVHAYKRERQGPLIGTPTAGAVSAARAFAMPGGNLLYVAVSGLKVDGDVLEGPGVAPDIEVQRPLPYSQGADPILARAVEFLATKASSANQ
jgi:carboxyl-terminal processing protease